MVALKFRFYDFVSTLVSKGKNDKAPPKVKPTKNSIDAIKIYPLIVNLLWQIHFSLCL